MNAVFHLVSAAASVLLVVLLLRAQRQYRFVRDLLMGQQVERQQRILVGAPIAFLEQFAYALGIGFENEANGGKLPARLDPTVWTEIFLRSGITLIRCSDGPQDRLVLDVTLKSKGDPGSAARLAQALGETSSVRLLPT